MATERKKSGTAALVLQLLISLLYSAMLVHMTIILLSSEIEELLHISDRILVLRQGRIVEEIDDIQQATQEMILAAALGGK